MYVSACNRALKENGKRTPNPKRGYKKNGKQLQYGFIVALSKFAKFEQQSYMLCSFFSAKEIGFVLISNKKALAIVVR